VSTFCAVAQVLQASPLDLLSTVVRDPPNCAIDPVDQRLASAAAELSKRQLKVVLSLIEAMVDTTADADDV
jgi:hypothetical protein